MIDIVLLLSVDPDYAFSSNSPLNQSSGDTGFITIDMRNKQNS